MESIKDTPTTTTTTINMQHDNSPLDYAKHVKSQIDHFLLKRFSI